MNKARTSLRGVEVFERMAVVAEISERLSAIEQMLKSLLVHSTIREDYSTAEFAALTRRSELTVRRWCLSGRIRAQKKASGRGTAKEWVISHNELSRYRADGLLPTQRVRDGVLRE